MYRTQHVCNSLKWFQMKNLDWFYLNGFFNDTNGAFLSGKSALIHIIRHDCYRWICCLMECESPFFQGYWSQSH